MKKLRLSALLAAGLLSACNGLLSDPDPEGIRYEADRAQYTRTEDVVTVLRNESDREVGYNLCTSTLEKRVGSGWVRVSRAVEHPCMLILFRLEPGGTVTYREPAAAIPGPGTYRLRNLVESPIAGRTFRIVTNPFTVL